jgi:trehalose utilization protein
MPFRKLSHVRLCWLCALLGTLAAFAIVAMVKPHPVYASKKIHVLCWSERTEPATAYPNGINGALVEMLAKDGEVIAKYANLDDPGQGLGEDALKNVDVVIWFGHKKHDAVTNENVDRVVKHVHDGMGLIALHSAHYSHPFQSIMLQIAKQRGLTLNGTPGAWANVKDEQKPEFIHILQPGNLIVKGVKEFTIPRTETYINPFNVPPPDLKILEGRYAGGQQDGNDGLLWNFGAGKVFYFRPGHETYPIYYQPPVRRILRNAVHYLASRAT